MIILGDRGEFYRNLDIACMIWVQELERDTQHSKKVELAPMCPNVKICKTVLDFGLHAVDSWFCISKFPVFRNPESGLP